MWKYTASLHRWWFLDSRHWAVYSIVQRFLMYMHIDCNSRTESESLAQKMRTIPTNNWLLGVYYRPNSGTWRSTGNYDSSGVDRIVFWFYFQMSTGVLAVKSWLQPFSLFLASTHRLAPLALRARLTNETAHSCKESFFMNYLSNTHEMYSEMTTIMILPYWTWNMNITLFFLVVAQFSINTAGSKLGG